MGLLSSKNKSSNVTNNHTDNSSINLNNGGVGVDGDGNNIHITDGGAFELVGNATTLMLESSAETMRTVAEQTTDLASEISADAFDFATASQDSANDLTKTMMEQSLGAIQNNNDRIAEQVERVAAISAGDNSELMSKAMTGAVVLGIVWAVTKMAA